MLSTEVIPASSTLRCPSLPLTTLPSSQLRLVLRQMLLFWSFIKEERALERKRTYSLRTLEDVSCVVGHWEEFLHRKGD